MDMLQPGNEVDSVGGPRHHTDVSRVVRYAAYTTKFLDSPLRRTLVHNSEHRLLERTATDTWVKGYIRHMGEIWAKSTVMNGIVLVD